MNKKGLKRLSDKTFFDNADWAITPANQRMFNEELIESVTLQSETDGLQKALRTETKERQKADDALGQRINDLDAETTGAIEVINEAIDLLREDLGSETEARENADTALGSRIDTLTSDSDTKFEEVNAALESLGDDLEAETEARENADTALGSRIDTLTSDTDTRFGEVNAAIESLGDGLEAETEARENADTALGSRIASLTSDSDTKFDEVNAALESLSDDLEVETEARKNADTDLGDRIDTLASATDIRFDEVNNSIESLGDNLQTEAEARENADTALGIRIDNLTSDSDTKFDEVNAAIESLGDGLNTETEARENADAALGGRIDTLTSDTHTRFGEVNSALESLGDDLEAETEARENADTDLGGRIDSLTSDSDTKFDEVNSALESLSDDLEAETEARENADTALIIRMDTLTSDTNIRFEEVNTAIGSLGNDLETETEARQNADTTLGSRIDALKTEVDRKIEDAVTQVAYDADEAILIISYENGPVKNINLPKENFLSEAEFFPETNMLELTLVDGYTFSVDMAELVDVYTAGNGLIEAGNQFSIRVDSASENYLTVSANGIKVTGVDAALNTLGDRIDALDTENSGNIGEINTALDALRDDLESEKQTRQDADTALDGRIDTLTSDTNTKFGEVNEALDSLADDLEDYLPLAGGELKGNLALNRNKLHFSVQSGNSGIQYRSTEGVVLEGAINNNSVQDSVTIHARGLGDINLNAAGKVLYNQEEVATQEDINDLSEKVQVNNNSLTNKIDEISNQIDALEVGGTNLLSGTYDGHGWVDTGSSGCELAIERGLFTYLYNGTGTANFISEYIPYKQGQEYTVSFKYRGEGSSRVTNNARFYLKADTNEDVFTSVFTPTEEWREFIQTFTANIEEERLRARFDNYGTSGDDSYTLFIKDIKLEKGNKATDYNLSVEDIQRIEGKLEDYLPLNGGELTGKLFLNRNKLHFASQVGNSGIQYRNDEGVVLEGGKNNHPVEDTITIHARGLGNINLNAAGKVFYNQEEVATQEDIMSVSNKVDAIEVGGTNLLNGTYDGLGWKANGSTNASLKVEGALFKFTNISTTTNHFITSDPVLFEQDKEYTLSFKHISEGTPRGNFLVIISPEEVGTNADVAVRFTLPYSGSWTEFSETFRPLDEWAGYDTFLVRLYNYGTAVEGESFDLYMQNIMLEEGNQKTSYNLSVKDNADINNKRDIVNPNLFDKTSVPVEIVGTESENQIKILYYINNGMRLCDLIPDIQYISISFDWELVGRNTITDENARITFQGRGDDDAGTALFPIFISNFLTDITENSGVFKNTYRIQNGTANYDNLYYIYRVYVRFDYIPDTVILKISNFKIEGGTKATRWCRSLPDIENLFSDLTTEVEARQNADITLNGRIDTLTSETNTRFGEVNDVIESLGNDLTGYLPLTGGTLTGELRTTDNIIVDFDGAVVGIDSKGVGHNMLARKQYTAQDGVTLVDYLEVNGPDSHLQFNTNDDPEYDIHMTCDTPDGKKIVAYTEDISDELGNYLPLSGGALTGLVTTGELTAGGNWALDSKYLRFAGQTGNGYLRYQNVTGLVLNGASTTSEVADRIEFRLNGAGSFNVNTNGSTGRFNYNGDEVATVDYVDEKIEEIKEVTDSLDVVNPNLADGTYNAVTATGTNISNQTSLLYYVNNRERLCDIVPDITFLSVSFDWEISGRETITDENARIWFQGYGKNDEGVVVYPALSSNFLDSTSESSGKFSNTYSIRGTNEALNNIYYCNRIFTRFDYIPNTVKLKISNFKLEYGGKSTRWCMSIPDIQSLEEAVTKIESDLGGYLPLTGGSLSGNLAVNGNLTTHTRTYLKGDSYIGVNKTISTDGNAGITFNATDGYMYITSSAAVNPSIRFMRNNSTTVTTTLQEILNGQLSINSKLIVGSTSTSYSKYTFASIGSNFFGGSINVANKMHIDDTGSINLYEGTVTPRFGRILIPENSDLNEYTEPGFYVCPSNSTSETIENNPSKYSFSLRVYTQRDTLNGVSCIQYLDIHSTHSYPMYFRQCVDGVWSRWNTIWHSANFTPGNYLALSGGTMTGELHAKDNIVVDFGSMVLGVDSKGNAHNLLSRRQYTAGDGVTLVDYMEVNGADSHLQFNTNDDPDCGIHITCDTPKGKKVVAYTEDISNELGTYLPLSGGSLTGTLALNRNKLILGNIDTGVSGISFVADQGVLLEGASLAGNDIESSLTLYTKYNGDINLNTTNGIATYNGKEIATVDDFDNYLPVSGGNITGRLEVIDNIYAKRNIFVGETSSSTSGATGIVLNGNENSIISLISPTGSNPELRFFRQGASSYTSRIVEVLDNQLALSNKLIVGSTSTSYAGYTFTSIGSSYFGGTINIADKINIDDTGSIVLSEGTVTPRFDGIIIPAGSDLNNYTQSGIYYKSYNVSESSSIDNLPDGYDNNSFSLRVYRTRAIGDNTVIQYLDGATANSGTWIRNLVSTGSWSKWRCLYTSANFNPDDYLPLSGGTITSSLAVTAGNSIYLNGLTGASRVYYTSEDGLCLRSTAGAGVNIINDNTSGGGVGIISNFGNIALTTPAKVTYNGKEVATVDNLENRIETLASSTNTKFGEVNSAIESVGGDLEAEAEDRQNADVALGIRVDDLKTEVDSKANLSDLNSLSGRVEEVEESVQALLDYKEEGMAASLVNTNGNNPLSFWTGTQAEYEAITTKSSTTLYIITNA